MLSFCYIKCPLCIRIEGFTHNSYGLPICLQWQKFPLIEFFFLLDILNISSGILTDSPFAFPSHTGEEPTLTPLQKESRERLDVRQALGLYFSKTDPTVRDNPRPEKLLSSLPRGTDTSSLRPASCGLHRSSATEQTVFLKRVQGSPGIS